MEQIKLKSEIQIRPITLTDTVQKSLPVLSKKTLMSKIFDVFFEAPDLNFEQWQRLEGKAGRIPNPKYTENYYRGGFS